MSLYVLPDQTIPENEKDENWYLQHHANFLDLLSIQDHNSQRELIAKYYRAYYGEMNEEELELIKGVTCPQGVDLGMEYIIYPLIRSKIEQMISDYFKRNFKKKIYSVNEKAKSEKLDKKLDMLSEKIMRDLQKSIKEETGIEPQTQNPDMELPEDIESFFENDFITNAEQTGQNIIDFLLYARRNLKRISQCCLDYFVSDRTQVSIDVNENHIDIRPIHSLDCYTDLDPFEDVQKDLEHLFESYWLSENEIFNKFPDLSQKKKNEIKAIFADLGSTSQRDAGVEKDDLQNTVKYGRWYRTDNKINRIRVVYGRWKSKKIIRYKVTDDKYLKNKKRYKKLPKDYKVKKKEESLIKTVEPDVFRYFIACGENCMIEYGIDEYRITSEDNLLEAKMDAVALVRENYSGSSTIKSIAAILYPLQKMASDILFELRFALKSVGNDRVLLYDTAQTPKELVKGDVTNALKKVNHFIKSDRILYINSDQKGGKKAGFNQFTSIDISNVKGVKMLIDSLAMIEGLADKFVGIPQERSGDIPVSQTATATQNAIIGSSNKNEIFFKPLDDFINVVLERMLAKAKLLYDENSNIQYVIGDMKTKFLKIYKEFSNTDLGLYFGDPGKDVRMQEIINDAARMSLSSANTPEVILGLIDVIEKDTASEKKQKFQEMLDYMEQVRQENAANAQKLEEEKTKQAEIQANLEDKKHKEQLQNNIDVANIYANNKAYTENLKNLTQEKIQQEKSKVEEMKSSKEKEKQTA